LTIIPALFGVSTITKKPGNTLEELNLKGRVKVLYVNYYNIEKTTRIDSLIKERSASTVSIFNTKGNIIAEKNYGADLSPGGETVYEYDENEILVETTSFNHSDPSDYTITNYTYDNNNNLIKIISYNKKGEPNGKSTFVNDDHGNCIEITDYYEFDGTDYFKSIYTYDDKGRKTKQTLYTSQGTLYRSHSWMYDESGKIIESNTFETKEYLMSNRKTYRYDVHGNYIESITYTLEDSLVSTLTNEYIFQNGRPMRLSERIIEYY
jgi:hypothetical protein